MSRIAARFAELKASGRKAKTAPDPKGATLKPASDAVEQPSEEEAPQMKYDPASVFASFQRTKDKT